MATNTNTVIPTPPPVTTSGQPISQASGSIVPSTPLATPTANASVSSSDPIDVSQLTDTPSFSLPPTPTLPSYDISNLPSLTSLLNPAPGPAQQKQTDLEGQLETDEGTLGTQPAAQIQAEATAGVPGFQKTVTDLTAQINQLQADAATATETSEDREAPTFAINGEQAQIERQRSVKALGLSATLQAAQGNLALAQDQADKAVTLQFAPVQAEIDYLKQALSDNQDNLSEEDKNRANELSLELQDRQTQLDQAKQDKSDVFSIAQDAAKAGADALTINKILAASTPDDAIAAAGNSLATGKTQVVNLGNGTSQLIDTSTGNVIATYGAGAGSGGGAAYNGDFAATISLAANAVKGATNAQRADVTNALKSSIANGDYASAYTTILQQTRAGLDGTNSTRFDNALNLTSTLGDLQTALQSYADAGGDTNILTGTEDQIQTKIGALQTDPKYAALAVQLDTAYQNYRLMLTGANFSSAEASAYASVLPSKSNTLALNLAKIQGAQAAANSTIEGGIKSVIGQGGVYIKQYAEGAQPSSASGDLTTLASQKNVPNDELQEAINTYGADAVQQFLSQ